MNSKKINVLATALILGIMVPFTGKAQIIRAGIKAGAQFSWTNHDDKLYNEIADIDPVLGFNAGAVLAIKVRERYFLHTEYIYSQKGKTVSGKIDNELLDKVKYNYFEIPVLFTMHFKAKLGAEKNFKWYLGAGPVVSYWLGGKGTVTAGDLKENGWSDLKYKLKFGERVDSSDPYTIYIANANRLQFGINFGGGILLEPSDKHKIMIDLRYEVGHTQLGKSTSADYLLPTTYDDNLKARNKGFRLSVMYLIEHNMDKKSRHKGKSTLKG